MNKCESILSFDGWCEVQDELYLSNNFFNGLMKISRKSGEISLLSKFPIGPVFSRLLHHQPIKYKNKIIFIPHFSYGVHIYDVVTQKIDYIPVKKDEWKNFRCVDFVVWNGKLWMILSYYENAIVSMDLETNEIEYYSDIYLPLSKVVGNLTDGVVFWSLLSKKDYMLYGVIDNLGYIVEIDIKNQKTKLIEVDKQKKFLDIAICGKYFYITQYKTKDIVIFDYINKSSYVVNNKYDEIISDDGLVYSNILSVRDFVFIVSNNGERIYSLKDNQISCYGVIPKGFEDIRTDTRAIWKRFYRYDIDRNRIYLFPSRANMMVTIDIADKSISGQIFAINDEWMNTVYQKEYVNEYFDECLKHGEPSYECDVVDLNALINRICK